MFMNLIAVALVLIIGFVWMNRGIFNSMLHALCAFVAGAIAFAVWEPLAVMLVNASPERGFFSFLEGIAWGVALIIPFAVVMLLLRLTMDKLIPNNIKNSSTVDRIGGAAFGLVTGVISTGILVIGIGNMRLSTDFMKYQPLWYSTDRATGAGSLVQSDTLWVPVDSIVAKLYGKLSQGTMSSEQPLAYWYPELELTGFASRVSPEGMGRNALRPEDFIVKGAYIVGPKEGTNPNELLQIEDSPKPQRYVDINGDAVPSGRIFGYVVEFEPGSKERGKKGAGQLIISNGQVRMLAKDDSTDETFTIFPLAAISESSKPGQFGRWRYDAEGVFISSTGGKSKVPIGFEFLVPKGTTPVALFVKNIRVATAELPNTVEYPSISQRDQLVRDGAILQGKQAEAITYNTEYTVTANPIGENSFVDTTARMLDVLPISSARRGLTVDDDGLVIGGQGIWDVKEEVGRNNAGPSKKLRVERYAAADDQALVKLDVSPGSPFGFLSEAAQISPLDQHLTLIDSLGNEYEAIGFEYKDNTNMEIRVTRGTPLSGIEDTPTLSTTRVDQKLRLVFIVTKGVEIEKFVIGDVQIARFSPPIKGGG